MIYFEEAYEERPERKRTLMDILAVGELLADMNAKHQSLEAALSKVDKSLVATNHGPWDVSI